MTIRFSVALLFVFSLFLCSGAEDDPKPAAEPTSIGVCVFTEETLAAAVNASRNGALSRVIVNCLSFKDSDRSLRNAIVSVIEGGTRSRFVATCANGVLILTVSAASYTTAVYFCSECRDSSQGMCATGRPIKFKPRCTVGNVHSGVSS